MQFNAAFSPHEIRAIAVKAMVDPRTVRRFLSGGRQPALVASRVRDALAALRPGAVSPSPAPSSTT